MEKKGIIIQNLKGLNTVITIGGIAVTSFELMIKAFKWYEKRHGKKKKEDFSRPIIKGI
jgi:hypothetical protein